MNIEGENRFLTSPIRDSYFAMCNTDLTSNFDGVTGFVQKNSYASPTNALRKQTAQLKFSLIDLEAVA